MSPSRVAGRRTISEQPVALSSVKHLTLKSLSWETTPATRASSTIGSEMLRCNLDESTKAMSSDTRTIPAAINAYCFIRALRSRASEAMYSVPTR